jgi:hypothetical protein
MIMPTLASEAFVLAPPAVAVIVPPVEPPTDAVPDWSQAPAGNPLLEENAIMLAVWKDDPVALDVMVMPLPPELIIEKNCVVMKLPVNVLQDVHVFKFESEHPSVLPDVAEMVQTAIQPFVKLRPVIVAEVEKLSTLAQFAVPPHTFC